MRLCVSWVWFVPCLVVPVLRLSLIVICDVHSLFALPRSEHCSFRSVCVVYDVGSSRACKYVVPWISLSSVLTTLSPMLSLIAIHIQFPHVHHNLSRRNVEWRKIQFPR